MNEIKKKPLIDFIVNLTNQRVGLAGETFKYIDTLEDVEVSIIDKAIELQEKEYEDMALKQKVQEAKVFLDRTDKKVLTDYEFKEGDNSLEWYIEERSKVRAFIRANEVI